MKLTRTHSCQTALLLATLALTACAMSPPVGTSWSYLQQQFGNQSIDNLLTTWGPPQAETRLTNGTRLVGYTYMDVYDYNSWDQVAYGCRATFTAPPPSFKITKITLEGDDDECYQLSLGHFGVSTVVSPEASYVFFDVHHDHHRH
jgi:hypothetical protein